MSFIGVIDLFPQHFLGMAGCAAAMRLPVEFSGRELCVVDQLLFSASVSSLPVHAGQASYARRNPLPILGPVLDIGMDLPSPRRSFLRGAAANQ